MGLHGLGGNRIIDWSVMGWVGLGLRVVAIVDWLGLDLVSHFQVGNGSTSRPLFG